MRRSLRVWSSCRGHPFPLISGETFSYVLYTGMELLRISMTVEVKDIYLSRNIILLLICAMRCWSPRETLLSRVAEPPHVPFSVKFSLSVFIRAAAITPLIVRFTIRRLLCRRETSCFNGASDKESPSASNHW